MVVYKTTNLVNGKIYVGKNENDDPEYLGSGAKLKAAIAEFGKQNFIKEILEVCNNSQDLCQREVFWIENLQSKNPDIGYNIRIGGEGWKSEMASEAVQKMWNSKTEEERRELSIRQANGRWKGKSIEEKREVMNKVHKSLEKRSSDGKEIMSRVTSEERSSRSKKGWANLSPEQRAYRASLMKKTLK